MSIQQAILKKIDESGADKSITDIWKQIVTEGYMEVTTQDEYARPIFVGLQALIEKTIADEMKKGTIKSAVNIVHTPKPVNPFSQEVEDSEPYESDADLFDDLNNAMDARSYVDIRRKVLEDFIASGGVVAAAYEAGAELTDEYQNNFERLGDKVSYSVPASSINPALGDGTVVQQEEVSPLFDHPVDGLDLELTGATLIVEDHNGLKTVFSMNAHQMPPKKDNRVLTWRSWFGQFNEKAISDRVDTVQQAVDPEGKYFEAWDVISDLRIEKALR